MIRGRYITYYLRLDHFNDIRGRYIDSIIRADISHIIKVESL